MFAYKATLVYIYVDYYGESWNEYEPEEVVFTDENIWLARNKILLYLAKKEIQTEFLYFYDIKVQLQLPDSQSFIDLGVWRLRFVGKETWHWDWEKERQIFGQLGALERENDLFYQLTQALYTPPKDKEAYLDLIAQFLEFAKNNPQFASLCSMHIGLSYLRLREEQKAFEFFSQGNEAEIKAIFYQKHTDQNTKF